MLIYLFIYHFLDLFNETLIQIIRNITDEKDFIKDLKRYFVEIIIANFLNFCYIAYFKRKILHNLSFLFKQNFRAKEGPIYLEEIVVQQDDIQQIQKQSVKASNNHLENFQYERQDHTVSNIETLPTKNHDLNHVQINLDGPEKGVLNNNSTHLIQSIIGSASNFSNEDGQGCNCNTRKVGSEIKRCGTKHCPCAKAGKQCNENCHKSVQDKDEERRLVKCCRQDE